MRVHGAHFSARAAERGELRCRFNTSLAAATVHSTTELQCAAPPSRTGHVTVHVSTNLQQYSVMAAPFEYTQLQLSGLSPPRGPMRGGTTLSIRGKGLQRPEEDGGLRCIFGNLGSGGIEEVEATEATFVSTQEVRCPSPAAKPVTATVQLHYVQAATIPQATLTYWFDEVAVPMALQPARGPVAGGTRVIVEGHHLLLTEHTRCRFGAVMVRAEAATAGMLACTAPPAAEGEVAVEVTTNGVDFSAAGLRFGYDAAPRVLRVVPEAVPREGGARVLVTGHGFSPHAAATRKLGCRFGAIAVLATLQSDKSLACTAPAQIARHVLLEMTNNLQDYAISGVGVAYVAVVVSRISPTTGPAAGGSHVQLHGTGFGAGVGSALLCAFGSLTVNATRVSEHQLKCVAPPAVVGLGTPVRLHVAGSIVEGAVPFRYMAEPRLLRLSPPYGPARGGTSVKISLADAATNEVSYHCGFEGVLVPAWPLGHATVECVSPHSADAHRRTDAPNVISVRLSANGVDLGQSSLQFAFEPPPTVLSISPRKGLSSGGTRLVVRGRSLMPLSELVMCRFGERAVPARPINNTALECTAPAALVGFVTVEVSNNGADFTSSGEAFEFIELQISSVVPLLGPVGGGTTVVFEGRGLHADHFGARIGEHSIACEPRSATSVACVTPASRPGPHLMTLALSSADAFLPSLTFNYVADARFENAYPVGGPTTGGTYVVVSGANFVVDGQLSCSFGARVVSAVWISSRQLACRSPPLEVAIVSLRVSNDGAFPGATAEVTGAVGFEAYAPIVVQATGPSSGCVAGGTEVLVEGSHFSARSAQLGYLRCRFNQSVVAATLLSASVLRCVSPPHAPPTDSAAARLGGRVLLEVSQNAQDYSRSEVSFEYRPEAEVHVLTPAAGDVGGGTLVQVGGGGFVAGELLCRFGTLPAVVATLVTAEALQCMAPVAEARGALAVEVSVNDGGDFSRSGVVFRYERAAAPSLVTPPLGPELGGTLVSVAGVGFGSSLLLKCRFGAVSVAAEFVSSELVNCSAPPHASGVVSVEVSTNGVDYSVSNVSYSYSVDPRVLALLPGSGPQRGGTNVSVVGSALLPGSRCRFGGVAALSSSWLSANELLCVAPAQPEGSYAVEVSGNTQEWTASRLAFAYRPPPQVDSLLPPLGPTAGGTVLTVHGAGMVRSNELACLFGGSVRVAATWIDAGSVACTAPPQRAPLAVLPSAAVEVSSNSQDFSADGVRFEYLSAASVLALSPTAGPAGGGTLVVVQGERFSARAVSLGSAVCLFGQTPASAVYINSSALQCASPNHLSGPVQISFGATRTTFGGLLCLYRNVSLHSIDPPLGPERGGTVLTLHGSDFGMSPVWCVFGTFMRTAAQVVSPQLAHCPTPPQSEGVMGVALGTAALGRTATTFDFRYVPEPEVSAISPRHGSLLGGTLVTVSGHGFSRHAASLHLLRCRFDQTAVPASLVDDGTLLCESTAHVYRNGEHGVPSAVAGHVALQISPNGLDYSYSPSSSEATFEYTAALHVDAVTPPHGAPALNPCSSLRVRAFTSLRVLVSRPDQRWDHAASGRR